MGILQNIKQALARVFPLHLNATVVALEDELDEAEVALYFNQCREENLELELDKAVATNNTYRTENQWLHEGLIRLREGNKALNAELNEVYQSMTPKLSTWPMTVSAHLEDSPVGISFIRVELPALRLSSSVNEAVRRGLFKGYTEVFAENIAKTAHKEVKAAVTDILNATLPIKK